jgi:hypothetical protein
MLNTPNAYHRVQLTYEPQELTSVRYDQFHPHITDICSQLLTVTRFAFADLIDNFPPQCITVTPGFINPIFPASDYADDLLLLWSDELTERYGFRPVKVTEYLKEIDDDYYHLTCDISLKMNDNINAIFTKHNASPPNFAVNLYCDDGDQVTRLLTSEQLLDLQWVELKNSCLWEQLTLAQWGEVLDDLNKEFLFNLLGGDQSLVAEF